MEQERGKEEACFQEGGKGQELHQAATALALLGASQFECCQAHQAMGTDFQLEVYVTGSTVELLVARQGCNAGIENRAQDLGMESGRYGPNLIARSLDSDIWACKLNGREWCLQDLGQTPCIHMVFGLEDYQ